jgi:hypothetical protein
MAELLSKTLTGINLGDKITEEVLINIGILMVLNKLIVLINYNYYSKKYKLHITDEIKIK